MKVYAVIAEGHLGDYGSEKFCIGIYTSMDKAALTANEYHCQIKAALAKYDDPKAAVPWNQYVRRAGVRNWYFHMENCVQVKEIELDVTYKMEEYDDWIIHFENDQYLGGYVE